jgi:hypothetical protein
VKEDVIYENKRFWLKKKKKHGKQKLTVKGNAHIKKKGNKNNKGKENKNSVAVIKNKGTNSAETNGTVVNKNIIVKGSLKTIIYWNNKTFQNSRSNIFCKGISRKEKKDLRSEQGKRNKYTEKFQ